MFDFLDNERFQIVFLAGISIIFIAVMLLVINIPENNPGTVVTYLKHRENETVSGSSTTIHQMYTTIMISYLDSNATYQLIQLGPEWINDMEMESKLIAEWTNETEIMIWIEADDYVLFLYRNDLAVLTIDLNPEFIES